jgi:hypothetical protein
MMMPAVMGTLMQLVARSFSQLSGAGFSPGRNPGFGGCGPAGNVTGGAGRSFNPCRDFLGGQSKLPYGCAQAEARGAEVEELASSLPPALGQHARSFWNWGKKLGVDPKFLAAVSMLETGKGTSKAFRNKNNATGVSNARGPVSFSSVDASIERLARVLAEPNGPYAAVHTIDKIGAVFCSVGAGNGANGTNHHWPRMVSRFYSGLGGNPDQSVK